MTTTSADDAVILPQSQGTGLSGESAVIDAAINGVLNRYVGGEYVSSTYSTGLAFQNHNASNDTVDVGAGIVFVQDNSTSTSGERGSGGNPQAESSTTSGYDTKLPEGHTYAVLLPTATEISVSDSTLNEVYVDIDDVTANNSVNLEHDGSTTASPGNTSLKIGETNPDDASADTRANDDASPTYDSLTVNGTTTTDALNADSAKIDNKLDWQEDPNSPFTASNTTSKQFTLANTYDQFKIVPRRNNTGFNGLQIDGVTSSNYVYIDNADQRTTGATQWDISVCSFIEEIVITSNTANNRFGLSVKNATEEQNNTVFGDAASGFSPPTSTFTLLDTNGTQRSVEVEVYGVEF